MRKIQLIIALAICFSTDLQAQFLVGKVPANVCPGSRVDVPYVQKGVASDMAYTAELSSSNGSFASPVTIGTLYSFASGTIQATMPATANGSGYRIRVYCRRLNSYSTESTPINTSNAPGSIPSIGDYGNASVGSGGNVKVAPLTSPANASWLRMSVSANNGFQGQLHVDPMTGIVSVINAKPQGTYQVKVTAVNCKGSASKTFTLTVTNPACSQGQFGSKKSFSYAFTVAGTLIGDFNNDGYPDIIQPSKYERMIRVNLNDRSGGFVSNDLDVSPPNTFAPVSQTLSLAQGDFNRDGNQDIVNAWQGGLRILVGDGLGGFISGTVDYIFNKISSVKVGDFNRDGLHDILVASETGTVSVLLGDGFGFFTAGPSVNLGFMSWSPLAVGDFNKDGNPDILTASASQKKYAIAMGNGSGGFAAPVTSVTGSLDYVVASLGSNTFGVGDFNGDGNLDLAATTFRSSPTTSGISILLGNGSGGFTLKSTLSASIDYITSITLADFNGDGKPDVAATNLREAYVFFGTGSAEFTNARQLEKDLVRTRNIEMLDFNNDNLQDVFIEDERSGLTLLRGGAGDIQLKGNGIAIADGSTTLSTNNNTNFGGNCLGVNIQKTFTIHNTGLGPIQLNSGAITFTGTDAAMFSVMGATLPKTLASQDSMTFTVRFSPTSAGNQTATIRIASDDCDEADYDFSCQATTYPPTPTAPTGLSATPMNSSAFVYFTTPVSTCSSSITAWQYSANNGPWTTFVPGTVPPRLYITNLTNGTTYSIKVRAVNTAGVGAESAPVSVTPRTQAGAPTGLTATPANNTASIAFTAPASNGGATITNYEYSINNGAWTARKPESTTSPLSLTGLVNGTTYSIKLRAVTVAGGGAESAALSFIPCTTAGAPTGLSATAGNASASIAFTAPASNGGGAITNYEYYSLNSNEWTALNPAATTSPLTITGLVNGITYSIKLRPVNAAGRGTESAAVSVMPRTIAGAPTALAATPGNTTASIAFAAPVNNGGTAITNYEYSTNNGTTWTARNPAATTSPLSLTGLVNGTTYSIKLRAVNAAGRSTESVAVSVTPGLASTPTNLVATATNGGVSIAFIAPTSTGGIAITNYQYAIDNGAWTARSPAATTSPLSITGLTNGTTYSIKLRAVNAAGGGTESAAVTVVPCTIPGAPTNLAATATNGGASIAFTAPTSTGGSAITNYEYSTNNGTTWTARNPVALTSPLSLTGLVNGTTYSIKLRAVNAAGRSTESAAVSVTPGVASAPTNPVATAQNGGVSIAFIAPTSTGASAITNYQYAIDNGAWTARSPVATTSPLSITGLTNGTTYSIKLRAVNAVGGGTESAAVMVVPFTIPGAPTNLAATATNGGASIAFTAPTSTGGSAITNYEYSTNNGTTWTARNPVALTSPLSLTGLVNGTTYSIKLRAVNAAGRSTESVAVSVTPGVASAPTASATAMDGQAFVGIMAPTNIGGNAITNYEYSINNGTTWTARNPASTSTQLYITGLTNGTTYSIKIRAVNAAGPGTESAAVSVTPRTRPGAPTNLVATVTNGGASIAFTEPTSTGGSAITNYEYSTNNGATWTARSPVATTSPLSLTGLVNGTTYSIKLRAVNIVGSGTESAAVSVVPCTITVKPTSGGTIAAAQTGMNPFNPAAFSSTAAASGHTGTLQYKWQSSTTSNSAGFSDIAGATTVIYDAGPLAQTTWFRRLAKVDDCKSDWTGSVASNVLEVTVTQCVNPTSGGTIAAAQTGMNPFNPAAFSSNAAASGHTGTLQYKWQSSTTSNSAGFSDIAGATTVIYDAGPLTQTTWYRRMARVDCKSDWTGAAASNVLEVMVFNKPGAPTGLSATAGNLSASIAFTAPASTGGAAITNYEYSINNGSTWTARNPVATTSPLSLTGLVNGTTYSIKLRAVNIVGSGTESAAVSVTPGSPPGAPTGLSATAGNASASIAFTAPANNGGTAITNYQYAINNGAWTARSPAATTSPLSLTGLVNGTTFSIKLRAVNAAGGGNESVAVSVTTGLAGAPTNLVATATNGGASIAFTAPTSTGGFAITNYQYAINNGAWTTRSPAATTSPLSLTGLVNATTYSIKLRAVNAVGGGTESASVSVTPGSPPGAPTGLSAKAGNASASIAFTAPASNGGAAITNYEYSINNRAWTARSPIATSSPLSLTGLVNGTTYSIKLRAVNALGGGTESVAVSVTPGVPGEPTAVRATPGNASASITFMRPTDNGAAITKYEYSNNNGAWSACNQVNSTTLSITGLVNGTTYSIKIRAVNAVGGGTESVAVSVTPGSQPDAPTGLSATTGNASASIAFTAPASNGGAAITNYEYSINNGTWNPRFPAATTSPLSLTGLVNGTTFSIKLRAVNAAGGGNESVAVSVTPGLAGAPTNLVATATNGGASIAFSVPTSTGGFAITNYQYAINNGAWTARSPAATTSPLSLTGLVNGTSYSIKLRAVNAVGGGTESAAVSVIPRTIAGAPTNLAATATNGGASIAFTAPASTGGTAITNYEFSTNNGTTWKARSPIATTSPLSLTGLTNGTNYSIKLRAVNAAGPGTESAPVSVTPRVGSAAARISISPIPGGDGNDPVVIYPNPISGGSFFIQTSLGDSKDVILKISDMRGREVYRQVRPEMSAGRIRAVLPPRIANGTYVIELMIDGKSHFSRLQVAR